MHHVDSSLRWRHNDHVGVSNHQPHGCLLNRLFRRRSKKTSKLRVTGLCAGNSPHKGPVTRKIFPFDDVIMFASKNAHYFGEGRGIKHRRGNFRQITTINNSNQSFFGPEAHFTNDFHRDSNSMNISFRFHPICSKIIPTKFCPPLDRCAVVVYAKFCSNTIYNLQQSFIETNSPTNFYCDENVSVKLAPM